MRGQAASLWHGAARPDRHRGFTLVELIVVMAVIAIIATISVPNLLSSRLRANESAAIATLRSISSAQAQCQTSAKIDADRNGSGEFAFFAELSGSMPFRSDESGGLGTEVITPPLLSGAFSQVLAARITRSGYVFQIYLPGATGAGQAEAAAGGAAGVSIDAGLAELVWCAYAWPSVYGNSGKRAFFVNQGGDVLTCRNAIRQYSGTAKPPLPDAAFLAGTPGHLTSTTAANSVGLDGERWLVVN